MSEQHFAFESGKISIAFRFMHGLGDSVVARKVFDAIIKLAPDCLIDIFYMRKAHESFAKAFYGDSKNLNRILNFHEYYTNHVKEYDAALWVFGTHATIWDNVNFERLNIVAPKLSRAMEQVEAYNKENVFDFKPWSYSVPMRNVMISRSLNVNFFQFLSCNGALPIDDAAPWLKVSPEFERAFKNLKLGNYITIYSNISRNEIFPKAKAWTIDYLAEYVALMKKFFPQIEVVQVGGGDEVPIANVDRKILGGDLELTKHILANSLLHVGCEGGLIHLATALGTTCLTFFGMSDWHYFSYPQNINVASEVCSPCMYASKDFGCMRGEKIPPCMLDITPQEVFDVTREYLNTSAES